MSTSTISTSRVSRSSAFSGYAVMVMILSRSGRSLKILRSRYQAYELIRARWAMLGAAGFVIPEALNKFGANCGPEAVWFKTGALLLDGKTLNYFGKPSLLPSGKNFCIQKSKR